jgi:uncharacterized protein
MTLSEVDWDSGRWLNAPDKVQLDGTDLVVTTREGSDFWRTTSYGFIRDSGHALLVSLAEDSAIEVSFVLDFEQQFDQAGVLVRADSRAWIKGGVEVSDGAAQVGAVVTRDVSDWSVSPVSDWMGQEVTIRASRTGNALTIRARAQDDWRLVRVAPIDPTRSWEAGPYCCSPERGGLVVRFTRFALGRADISLHPMAID